MFYDNQICMHGNVKVCFNTDKYKCMRNWILREKGVSGLVYMGQSRLHTLCYLFLQRNNFGILLFSAKAVVCFADCWKGIHFVLSLNAKDEGSCLYA